VATHTPNKCKNCDVDLAFGQAYCAACGQRVISTRLTLHQIAEDLLHAFFHADRSVLSLIGLLLVRPGAVALNYVQGKRKRYFGPFALLGVIVAVTSAAIVFTGFHAISTDSPNAVADFLQTHINLVFLAEVPLLAAFTRILDARGGFNFAEYLVLAAYTSSIRILFAALVVIPVWYLSSPSGAMARYLYYAYLLISILYFGFAASQFLRGKRTLSWAKGILAAILTWVSTQGLATLAAVILQQFSTKG
jgi:hypothetical protein